MFKLTGHKASIFTVSPLLMGGKFEFGPFWLLRWAAWMTTNQGLVLWKPLHIHPATVYKMQPIPASVRRPDPCPPSIRKRGEGQRTVSVWHSKTESEWREGNTRVNTVHTHLRKLIHQWVNLNKHLKPQNQSPASFQDHKDLQAPDSHLCIWTSSPLTAARTRIWGDNVPTTNEIIS